MTSKVQVTKNMDTSSGPIIHILSLSYQDLRECQKTDRENMSIDTRSKEEDECFWIGEDYVSASIVTYNQDI